MSGRTNLTKTLDELDPPAWGEPAYHSYLVEMTHRLRRKPIGEFSAEDLRIMIGQNISLRFLVPLAVKKLEYNPLSQGDFYEGDLLASVLRVNESYWRQDAECRDRVATILERVQLPAHLREYAASFRANLRPRS